MGKKWDYDVPGIEVWKECLRVLKPGGTALIFAGSRTQHRMAVNVEDAGFILKDCIMWLYGSGFPKATDISKQLDKGHKRKVVGKRSGAKNNTENSTAQSYTKGDVGWKPEFDITTPTTEEAKLWNGWKSHGLKPAYEPILVAMKPNDGTYANNALKYGVSGLNIDGGRIGTGTGETKKVNYPNIKGDNYAQGKHAYKDTVEYEVKDQGRFPANIILECICDEEKHTNPNCPCYMLDEQSGESKSTGGIKGTSSMKKQGYGFKQMEIGGANAGGIGDKGGASRFFYCAKASKTERNKGCEGLEEKANAGSYQFREDGSLDGKPTAPKSNFHPTVKPLKLMEYLCTLTKTPTGGIVLDPFAGSGTTGLACQNTGRDYILIEREEEYIEIIKARLRSNEKLL